MALSYFKKEDTFSEKYTVSEKIYNGFIDLFNDKNPLHTQDEFAVSKNFSSKVMHGAILCGFLSHFIGECLPTKNVVVLSYKLQFTKPVYINDVLLFTGVVSDVFESVNSIDFSFKFFKEDKSVVSKGTISIKLI
jgi:3-hydroxybutyryl-CoA dehydratase